MKELDYKTDGRFTDIGDLPTGFYYYPHLRPIFIRPFTLTELFIINKGQATGNIDHIIRAVDLVCSVDVLELTDGDFEFILAWLQLNSFPAAPLQVSWECNKVNLVNEDGSFHKDQSLNEFEQKLNDVKTEVCNTENNEIAHQFESTLHYVEDDFDGIAQLEQGPALAHPCLDTKRAADLLKKEEPEDLVEAARWIKEGDTLREKYDILLDQPNMDLYNLIKQNQEEFKIGVSQTANLRCRVCDNRFTHTSRINPCAYFADNSQTNLMDMQYKMATALNMPPDNNIDSKTFLYHYSCLIKDEQEQAAKRNQKKPHRR